MVICNDDYQIGGIDHMAFVCKSDHDLLPNFPNVKKNKEKGNKYIYDCYKEPDGCRHGLQSVDWMRMVDMDGEEAWTFFKDRIDQAKTTCVLSKLRGKHGKPLWVTRGVKRRNCFKNTHKISFCIQKMYKISFSE